MSEHTPGPWKVRKMQSPGWSLDYEPNARLIAAAPDLLAACKASLGALLQLNYIEGTGYHKAVQQVEAAIDAATK